MIREAKLSEIPEILAVTKACADHMVSMGIFQWNDHYPSQLAFENDIDRQELYVIEQAGQLIAGIVISTHMDDEYIPIKWLTESNQNIYVHRLFVHPDFQGKGYAQNLMAFAEDYAKSNKFISVRLDTFSQNKRNQKFYETRGYTRLGNVYFPKQSEHPFYCYELVF